MFITRNAFGQQGFTLLEIVLVLFLLGLMASSTLLLTQGVEDQAKYDETVYRLKAIHTAIIGDTNRTINGRPQISGFATDMGRLPRCIRELVSMRNCDDDDDLLIWAQDPISHIGAGWRGPYLQGNTEINGISHYRDGYGNADPIADNDFSNSGWEFDNTSNPSELIITSKGFDSLATDDDISHSITLFDYQASLGADWQDVMVTFTNTKSTAIVIEQTTLRLRLNTPADGDVLDYTDPAFDTPTKRDGSTQFSRLFPSENKLLLSAAGTLELADDETLNFDNDVTKAGNEITLKSGDVITYTDSTLQFSTLTVGNNCVPNCVLTFTNSIDEADGALDKITANGSVTITLPNHYLAPTTLVAERLAKASIELGSGSSLLTDTVTLPNSATITLPSNDALITGTTLVFIGTEIDGTKVTVSEAFTLNNVSIETDTTHDIFTVPSGTIRGATPNSLIIPVGSIVTGGAKSFSILCESNGLPFNGDCSTSGTHLPLSITLIPRNTIPVNTSPLFWEIN